MNLLPENGRVVVIDDNYEEVLPLLKVLSKNKVPVMYFTGDVVELPDRPFSDVRIIFLDIELATEGQPDKTKISTASNVIYKIIGTNNNPYFIIAWTKFNNLLDRIRKTLKNNSPLLILNLEKSECKNENGEFDIGIIENRLRDELKKAGIFHLFMLWDNLVHKSAGEIVNDFSTFYSLNNDWDKRTSIAFYNLAMAYSGLSVNPANTDEMIKNALLAFNGTFLDTLENNIREYTSLGEKHIKMIRGDIDAKISAIINTKLLCVMSGKSGKPEPGNVYELDVLNTADKDKIKVKINELFNSKGKISKYKKKNKLYRQLKHVFLEVSPVCDYAQKKWRVHRVLPGLLWPHEHEARIKKAEFYIYKTPLFEIKGNLYRLVLDLRHLGSLNFSELQNKKPLFRIRHELLVDIQAYTARHINRPGVTSL